MLEFVTEYEYVEGKDDFVPVVKQVSIDEIDFVFTVEKGDSLTGEVITDKYYGQAWGEIEDGSRLFFKSGIIPEIDDIVYAYVVGNEDTQQHNKGYFIRHFEPHCDLHILRASAEGFHENILLGRGEQIFILGVCIGVQSKLNNLIESRELTRRDERDLKKSLIIFDKIKYLTDTGTRKELEAIAEEMRMKKDETNQVIIQTC